MKLRQTPCPSLLSFFPHTEACILVFGGLFLALSRMGATKERVFLLACLSLGLLLFKFENARNFLAGKARVHRKSLGRPVPGLSYCFSVRSPCQLPMPPPCLRCQNILFQFSASRLPRSCLWQLDSADVAKTSLPAHYPTPCHAPSLHGPNQHKLIGLNPVINRLEKQLSMFVSLPKAGLFGHGSPLSFPVL